MSEAMEEYEMSGFSTWVKNLVDSAVAKHSLIIQLGQVRAEQKRLHDLINALAKENTGLREVIKLLNEDRRLDKKDITDLYGQVKVLATACAQMARDYNRIMDPEVKA